MDTIVIGNKTFVIRKHNLYCNKCLFHYSKKYPNGLHYCHRIYCDDYIVIREVTVIDRIIMWLKKKKIKK